MSYQPHIDEEKFSQPHIKRISILNDLGEEALITELVDELFEMLSPEAKAIFLEDCQEWLEQYKEDTGNDY